MPTNDQLRAENEFRKIFGPGFIRLTSNWRWRYDRFVLQKQRREFEIWRNHNEAVVFSKRGTKAFRLPLSAVYKEWRGGEYVRWRVRIEDIERINRYFVYLNRYSLFSGIDLSGETDHVLLSRLVAATCGIDVYWERKSPRYTQREVHHISKCTHDDRLFNLRVLAGDVHDKLHRNEMAIQDDTLRLEFVFEPPDMDLNIYEKVDVDSADRWTGDFLTFLHRKTIEFRLGQI